MIKCPKGHDTGPFQIVEDAMLFYEIDEIDHEEKVISGDPSYSESDGENTRLMCRLPVTVTVKGQEYQAICGEEFPIPDDYELEYA